MVKKTVLESLKEAHLDFIIKHSASLEIIEPEVDGLMFWLTNTPLHFLIPEETVQTLTEQRLLHNSITSNLLNQVIKIIQGVLDHPENGVTPLSTLVPDVVVEEVAQYLSKQHEQRKQIIHSIFSNPTYAKMISQTVSHAVTDYMQNNALTKSVPGVGSIMKFGKAALEKATSSNLDDALQHYLNKNINNIIATSEKIANKHLDNLQVYNVIKGVWSKIRKEPVSVVRQYVNNETLEQGAELSSRTWDHLRTLDYIKHQLQNGVTNWYSMNKDRNLMDILSDFHINEHTIRNDIRDILMPIVELLIQQGYLRTRIGNLLDLFYTSDEAKSALDKASS